MQTLRNKDEEYMKSKGVNPPYRPNKLSLDKSWHQKPREVQK